MESLLNTSVATQMMKIINGYREEVIVKLASKYGFNASEAIAYLEKKPVNEQGSSSSSSEDEEPKIEKVKKTKKRPRVQSLNGRDFISVDDFSLAEILSIFRLAAKMKSRPERYRDALKGKMMALMV